MAAPTPRQIDALPALSPAQIVKLIDLQIATIAMRGQAVDGDGRTLTRADVGRLQQVRAYYANLADLEIPTVNGCPTSVGGVLIPRYPNDA